MCTAISQIYLVGEVSQIFLKSRIWVMYITQVNNVISDFYTLLPNNPPYSLRLDLEFMRKRDFKGNSSHVFLYLAVFFCRIYSKLKIQTLPWRISLSSSEWNNHSLSMYYLSCEIHQLWTWIASFGWAEWPEKKGWPQWQTRKSWAAAP